MQYTNILNLSHSHIKYIMLVHTGTWPKYIFSCMLLLKNNLFSRFLAMAAVEKLEINEAEQPSLPTYVQRYITAGVI